MEAQTERFHCSGGHSTPHGIFFIANTNIYICWGAGRLFFYPPFKATVSESEDLPCYPLLLLHRPLWDFHFLFASDESKIIFIQPQIKRAREEGIFLKLYGSKIIDTQPPQKNFSPTCMAGPRGAGRLGVAAEGGAKPIVFYFTSYFTQNVCFVLATSEFISNFISQNVYLFSFLPAPPESWDSLRSTLI